jgi:hypothetical protein
MSPGGLEYQLKTFIGRDNFDIAIRVNRVLVGPPDLHDLVNFLVRIRWIVVKENDLFYVAMICDVYSYLN